MIRAENITKIFKRQSFWGKDHVAVDHASFHIDKGETLGLVGESGCGKSTLARILLKLIPFNEGKIFFDNQDITNYKPKEMQTLRKDMQIIFQHPDISLNPRKKIQDSLMEPFIIHKLMDKNERMLEITKYLHYVGLQNEILDRYPHQVSGGQIQRIVLARALIFKPKFLVLDEATSMLDVSVQAQIIDILKKIQNEFHVTYLFISHDIALVQAFCNNIAVMKEGKIIEMGSSESIYDTPNHPYTKKLLKTFKYF